MGAHTLTVRVVAPTHANFSPMRLSLALLLAVAAPLGAQTVLVKPYLQPGDGATLAGTDMKVIAWLTDQTPGEFTVEYQAKGQPVQSAKVERVQLDFAKAKPKPTTPTPAPKATPEPATTIEEVKESTVKESAPVLVEKEQHYFKYSAALAALPFDSEVTYRVKLGATIVRTATAKTRASAGKPFRAVLVGDIASGKPEQNGIAWQAAQQHPDFLVALGDIVYSGGRVSEYLHHFWTTLNDVEKPGPKTGAPIMASVPIYPIIGNHDADARKLPDYPDAFGAFYFFNVPLNGPGVGPWNLPLGKDAKVAADFRQKVGAQYPAMNQYSFDYGPAHFVALDSNSYTSKDLEKLIPWLEKDLRGSTQPWKFVCFHAPSFHTSKEHFTEQKMRLLEPTFAACGVDVVFAGHVHNYQRSMPLRFTPNPPKRDPRGRVNGDFVLDETFDGVKDTTPEGIIHIVSGGGGAKLYSVNLEKTIAGLKKDHPGNYVPFTAKYYADKHSFSVLDLTPTEFSLRQINIDGQEIDRVRITK
jgi:acid phosphatase type 7